MKKQNTYWKKTKTRENLVLFFNELMHALYEAQDKKGKRLNKTESKKVCKPILDRWEKVFDGAIGTYNLTMKVPMKWVKQATQSK